MSRLSFDEIALRLERSVLPIVQKWGKELERDFENTQIRVNAMRSDNHPRLPQKYSYQISIECREKVATKRNFGDLLLSIDLSQFDATSDPTISAYVGMLVDVESDNDWGIRPISVLFPPKQKVDEDLLERLDSSLPDLYQSLRTALGSTDVKQVHIQSKLSADEKVFRSFFITPAVPAAIFSLFFFLSGSILLIVVVFVLTYLVAGAHVLVLGLPAFWLGQRLQAIRWWTCIIIGFVIGGLPSAIWRGSELFLWGGLFGACGGFAFWLLWQFWVHSD